ncbi:MAG TPA: AMP-binding protein, partial [Micromonospora sp.]
DQPPPRLAAMAAAGTAAVVVTRSDLPPVREWTMCTHRRGKSSIHPDVAEGLPVLTMDGLAGTGLPAGELDGGRCEDPGGEPTGAPGDDAADPSRVAYLMFTSGSSGSPKGVVVEHRAIANTLAWYVRRLGLTADDRVCWFSSPGFDASCTDVWSALRTGATLHVVPPAARFDPEELRDWLLGNRIAAVFLPTKLGEALLRLEWPGGTALRHLVTGGEAMRATVPPGLPFEVINAYGPTEATVYTTWTPALEAGRDGPPPIGRPMPGTWVRVLNADGRQVPIGAVGELHIGGAQLARGYAGAAGETEERFVTHPEHGRLYRTGDLVAWGADGQLRYVARNDDQVQIRGQRAEPGEVEHHLRQLDGVADAAVLAGTDDQGDAYLAGYVVPTGGFTGGPTDAPTDARTDAPTDVRTDAPADAATGGRPAALTGALTGELAERLRQRLPGYLVPTRWAVLDRLPVNANGKLDRSALPEPALPPQPAGANGAPVSDLERRLQALWCEQLGLDTVGVESSFFQLGGTSLTVTRLLNRVRTQFGRDVDTLGFFSRPTVRGLALLLTEEADTPA